VAVFFARRLLSSLLVLAGFSFLSFSFFASRFNPLKGKPVLHEYWRWLRGIPSGHSLTHGLEGPILPALEPALAHTLVLLGLTFLLVVALSVAFAAIAAWSRGSLLDLSLRGLSYLAWGIPAFLFALIVQEAANALGGAHGLGPFPIAGWPGRCPTGIGINAGTISPCPAAGNGIRYALNVLRYATFPAVALAAGFIGLHARYLRSALVTALEAPFATTARAKGLPESRVVIKHALRASLSTFVAALLSDFGAIFGAAMAIDWIFQFGGLGSLFIIEVNPNEPSLDAYAVQLLLLVTGALLVTGSLLSEFAVLLLDPRARPD
jgi:peptide/nickel transport system permease protein